MIFIVDDDQAVRRSLRFLLSSAGMESRSYADAQEFLARCDPSESDCLIVDVDLPGMDGIQLLRRVRAAGLGLPVFIISGYASMFMRQQAREAGATAFFEKPVDVDDVVALIRNGEAAAP